jgi:predicted enzyme related to lactoylglutathione lyase
MNTQFVLAVPDLDRSVKFYQKVMGFRAMPIEDDGWMFMVRDHCTIRLGECPDAILPSKLGDHSYFAYLEVDDIDGFYNEVQSAGGKTLRAPRDEPWGMREFPLVTIDGHRIMIGQRL